MFVISAIIAVSYLVLELLLGIRERRWRTDTQLLPNCEV